MQWIKKFQLNGKLFRNLNLPSVAEIINLVKMNYINVECLVQKGKEAALNYYETNKDQ